MMSQTVQDSHQLVSDIQELDISRDILPSASLQAKNNLHKYNRFSLFTANMPEKRRHPHAKVVPG